MRFAIIKPRRGAVPRRREKEDKMDILTSLLQLFGNTAGSTCAGGTCAAQTAQAASAATTAASAMGGFSGLLSLLCRLLGLGC